MFTDPPTVRATVRCSHCAADNELTINSVADDQVINCSSCGGRLGTVADVIRGKVEPVVQQQGEKPLVYA
jgi:hypothetical protein